MKLRSQWATHVRGMKMINELKRFNVSIVTRLNGKHKLKAY